MLSALLGSKKEAMAQVNHKAPSPSGHCQQKQANFGGPRGEIEHAVAAVGPEKLRARTALAVEDSAGE